MRHTLTAIALVLTASSIGGAAPKGTVPKTSAADYPKHAEQNGASLGVMLASPEQARKLFVSDVNRCCTVLEVAVYPSKTKACDVSLNDFVLRVKGSETATKPSTAKVIASSLQKRAAKDREIAISPTVGVGYGNNGYDPVTGRGGGGLSQQVGVGVGIGKSGPNPASTDKDRIAMEAELSEKGLPEGLAPGPVAGYIYFPIANKKGAVYQLEYTVDGQKFVVTVP